MKENLVTIWDKRNEKASGLPIYDLWLDNYYNILVKNKKNEILDLGCGIGSDTLYLRERGYKVLSCDISKTADSLTNSLYNIFRLFHRVYSKIYPMIFFIVTSHKIRYVADIASWIFLQ